MKKQLKKAKGITLIALVITIIVLLILAGVSIATLAGEGGILSKATTAKNETNQAGTREQIQMAVYGSYDDNGKLNINQLKTELGKIDKIGTITDTDGNFPIKTKLDGYDIIVDNKGNVTVNGKGEESGKDPELPTPPTPSMTLAEAISLGEMLDENEPTIIADSYGNLIKVPEGFKIASDSADNVTGGVVIEDATKTESGASTETTGNQFVWIPVGTVYTSPNKASYKTISLGRYVFKEDGSIDEELSKTDPSDQLKTSSATSLYYMEELKDSTTDNPHAKDIVTFKSKAEASGGYYVGRYEARTKKSRPSHATPLPIATENPSDYYPYVYVKQAEAESLSRNMYGGEVSFVSDLMNSFAWDTTLLFLQTFDDRSEEAKKTPYSMSTGERKSSGASNDVVCNVWDFAGNSVEWTTEKCSYSSTKRCTVRGAKFLYGGKSDGYASRRKYEDVGSYNDGSRGFRVILYL